MAGYGASVSGRPADSVKERIERDWFDESGELLVRDMDQAGVDRAVVFVLDFGPFSGTRDAVSLEQRYEVVAKAVRRHADRLVFFGGIDPRRPDAARFLEEAVARWGVRGVKLWPPAGFAPNERCCYRVYEKCAQLGLPVVIHTGVEIGPLRSTGCQPVLASDVASDFPELTIVLAHAGMTWWEEAASLAWHYPNVYLDIAYWQVKYLASPEIFYRQLRQVLSIAGARKVFFGSDWPAMRTVARASHPRWVALLRELPRHAGVTGVEFTEQEIGLVLGEAASGVLLGARS
jgi:predicted TIM-barrel fold metal-dependent hydrolase